MSCQTTKDLGVLETREYQENLKVCWRQTYNTLVIAAINYRDPFQFCLISWLYPINFFPELNLRSR